MCCAFRCKSHHNCKGNGRRGVVGWWVLLLLMVPFPKPPSPNGKGRRCVGVQPLLHCGLIIVLKSKGVFIIPLHNAKLFKFFLTLLSCLGKILGFRFRVDS